MDNSERNEEIGDGDEHTNDADNPETLIDETGLFDFLDDFMNQPVYPGHTLTVFNSVMLIWIFALTHSVTACQLSDLLVLINAHCLTDVPIFQSVQRIKNFFASLKSPMNKHYFCSYCLANVTLTMKNCPNAFCDKDLTKKNATSYFIEFPIEQQLMRLFKRDEFLSNLKTKFNRRKRNKDNIEDIYDGVQYQKLSSPGQPLSDMFPFNISFTWNTDGIPVFKSSKYSIWPMYLMINELPYHQRKEKSNMIFYGLWFGELKPSINLFCEPLLQSLRTLEMNGIDIIINDKVENIKAFLICGTADLPAKATALNMVQFNGKYSCSVCLQPGKTEKTGASGHTHVFPYQQANPTGPNRTRANVQSHFIEALNTGETVFGLKGPSFLSSLRFYDFGVSTSIDYMHCVLLGITKKLMTLWFSVSHASECFSLVQHISFVDNCLKNIKPPHQISRRPRSVSDHLKFWKASEFRSWLFFYSVPIMCTIMEPLYFFHYCSFAESIWILCQDSISDNDLVHCSNLLNYFVCMFGPLYGARYMTLNAHLLLHLPKCVKDLGPLFVYSCFPFESLNGDLLKLFHGTQYVETQILSAVNNHQILPLLIGKMSGTALDCSIVKKFLNKSKICLGLKIDHNVYVVGQQLKSRMSKTVKDKLANFLGHQPVSVVYYGRLKVRNIIIHSEFYTRVTARNSYTVKYFSNDGFLRFGLVKTFAVHRMKECLCEKLCHCNNSILAIITQLEKVKDNVIDTAHHDFPQFLTMKMGHVHVLKLEDTPNIVVIGVHQIIALCVSVNIGSLNYVCEFPNTTECD